MSNKKPGIETKECEICGLINFKKEMEECAIFKMKEFVWTFIKKIYLCKNCAEST